MSPTHQKKKKSSLIFFHNLENTLVFLFIFLLPTQFGKHFFFDFSYLSGVRIDYLAPTIYITDILAFCLIVFHFKYLVRFALNKYVLLLLLLLAVNSIFAISSLIAFYKSAKILEFVFIFAIYKKSASRMTKPIFYGLLLGAFVQFFLATSQLTLKHSLQGVFYLLGERYFTSATPEIAKMALSGIEFIRPYGTFSHPNSMGGFYLLVFFFTAFYKPFSPFVLLKHLLLTLSSLLVFLSFSKIAIATFIVLYIIYFITTGFHKVCRFCMMARILTVIIVGGIFLLSQGDPLTAKKRYELAVQATQIIGDNFFKGVGLGNYLLAQHQFPIRYPYFFLQPVHNIYLLLFAEGGVVLFSVYVFGVVRGVLPCLKKNSALMFVCIVLLITGFFDHYWVTLQQNMLLIAVFGGVLKSL